MSDVYTFDDADRFNNILQMLMRCCVKVIKKILPIFVTSLGYTCVDQFLLTEKPHVLKMPLASLPKNQDILYPPTRILTNIDQWDMSLLTCIFTHIQRKLITKEIGNPIDPIINLYKAEVLATTVGQEHEEKLYPPSGKPTNLNKWNMSVCACIFSEVCPKPYTLHVRIAESLNSLREMRNSLCHTESPEMEPLVYEEHITVLKDFVNSGLTYIGDVAFETEIKKGMDDIENGKMRRYIVADHKHLQESYANDRDTSQRITKTHMSVTEGSSPIDTDVVFAKLTDDHKNLLYSSFAETFTQLVEENAPAIVGEINPELKDFFTHYVFQTWKIFNNPYEGRRVVSAKRECLKIKLHFDDAVRMWEFIKIYVSGTLDSLIEPIQTFLRTKEGFENLEMTVVVPNVFAALNQLGESKEIDSSSMMCVLELLNQRLVPLEQKQQDDTVRKSLEMKRMSSQQYITNAGVQTGEMEYEGPEDTLVETTERLVVEESQTPLVELHLDEPGQTIKTLTSEETEQPIEGYTIDEAGEKVMTMISKEPEKLVKELTVDESGQKVKTLMPEKSEKTIKELPIEISEKPMTILSTNVYESKKELVSYTCEACLQDMINVQYMVKCRDCDKILCSDCTRVHNTDHIVIVFPLKMQQADDLINMKFKPATTITVEYPSHHLGGFLSDLFLLPGDKLLLGDWNDRKVKLVDLRTNNLLSQVSVPGHPMGMCLISENRVAVTLRITGMIGSIQFVEIHGQLSLQESIKLDGGCLAIGYHNDRLMVSYRSGKVEKMDMSGKVIEKIDSDDSGKPVFGYPWQLTVVGEGQEAVLYVSDNYKNTITKLDMDLNIIQTFEDPALREPAGITAVGNQLLICNRGSNNIMCLDLPSSQMTQLLKKNAKQNPKSVCYSQQQKRLYVTGEHDNVVSVYMPSITI